MSSNKTVRSGASVAKYIAEVTPDKRQAEARLLMPLFERATGFKPAMWGDSIIGFGEYHYKYASGREGDFLLTGFSPRKAAMTIYIMPGFKRYGPLLSQLGKFKTSVSCLYATRLENIELSILEQLVTRSVADMKQIYPQWKP